MADVSCRMFEMYEKSAQELGIPPERLLRGSSLTLAHVRNKSNRAPWDEWTIIAQNLEDVVGGPASMRRWGTRILEHDYTSVLRRLAAVMLAPSYVYQAVLVWLAPVLYPHLEFGYKRVTEHHLRITVEIPQPYRGSAPWLRLVEGTLVVLPRMVGLPDAEVVGRITPRSAVYDIFPPAHRSRLAGARALARSALRPRELLETLESIRRDVHTAYQASLASERDLRRILDGLPDPVVVVSGARIVDVNPAFRDLFLEHSTETVEGVELGRFVEPEQHERLARLLDGTAEAGEPLVMVQACGTRVVTELSSSTDLRYRGREARVLVIRDITERLQTDALLAQTDRVAALGTLAAGVAHDINNPLTAVLGSLQLLEMKMDNVQVAEADRAQLTRLVEGARSGAERVTAIARDLVRFPRERTSERRRFSLIEPLDAMLRLARNEIRHRAILVTEYDEAPLVQGNPSRIGQVFLNLLINAAQAIPVGDARSQRIVVRVFTLPSGEAAVEVEDTGCGIEPELLERIFEPLFTTRGVETNTGLGLATARRIVHDHGGRIEVESTVGRGTKFRVILPAAEVRAEPDASLAQTPSERLRRSPLRVLVVDDEVAIHGLIRGFLPRDVVECVTSGRAAQAAIRVDPERDIIICDVMMPDGTGPDLYNSLEATHPQLCGSFLFMTGGTFTEETRQFLLATEVPCLKKPFRAEELARAVALVAGQGMPT